MDWYFKALRNYIGFGGRARRKEYWMFHLVNFILAGVLSVLDKMLGLHIAKDEGALTTIYTVLVFRRFGQSSFAACTTPTAQPGGCCCC